MSIIGDRRSGARMDERPPEPPSHSREVAPRVAAVLERAPGWRFHEGDLGELLGDGTVALVLADGTVAGVAERRPAAEGDPAADAAVRTLLSVFAALVETERTAAEAMVATARAREEAVHDHLTGLLNRRGWEQALDQE